MKCWPGGGGDAKTCGPRVHCSKVVSMLVAVEAFKFVVFWASMFSHSRLINFDIRKQRIFAEAPVQHENLSFFAFMCVSSLHQKLHVAMKRKRKPAIAASGLAALWLLTCNERQCRKIFPNDILCVNYSLLLTQANLLTRFHVVICLCFVQNVFIATEQNNEMST